MATGDLCTTAELKGELGITDTDDDTQLDLSVTAGSRQVAQWIGRQIHQDAAVAAREFFPTSSTLCDLLDQPGMEIATEISTATGLIVKIDTGDDGTFATTLTINTDFVLLPRNAAADNIGYGQILMVGSYTFPRSSTGRPTVQVTAKFGWPSVPSEVKKAALIQAAQHFKSKDAIYSAVALGDSQVVYVGQSLDPRAKGLIFHHQLPVLG